MSLLFEDFGLNPERNFYENVKHTIISDGIEYAKKTIEPDGIIFVVDRCNNTRIITFNADTGEAEQSKLYYTSYYKDVDRFPKRIEDLTIIGSFMMEMTHEYGAMKYGVIVENPDGSFRIL